MHSKAVTAMICLHAIAIICSIVANFIIGFSALFLLAYAGLGFGLAMWIWILPTSKQHDILAGRHGQIGRFPDEF
jgi:uncharacterized membrane protein YgaE (UPF0421/DUF939 family)